MGQIRVLVVDDDPLDRTAFCSQLNAQGFNTFSAASGSDALRKLKELHADLVLADVGMADMDGIQLLCAMRKEPELSGIPVILMTGIPVPSSMLEATSESLGSGPIYVKGDTRELADRINHTLHPPAAPARSPSSNRRGSISIDPLRRQVFVAGQLIPQLPPKRFDLLFALFRRTGPVPQQDLLDEVWGPEGDLKVVQMTTARLRDDLRRYPELQIRTEAHSYELLIDSPPL
ncbi:MAG: response regulator transcription factor [Elusimicrobia bacterium]|nr:response regulator transcription factor [Elusimicrobiota bacterium]